MSEKNETIDTLCDALPREMTRVRDELMPAYQSIGAPGGFALACMRHDLDVATKALAEGDVVAMMVSYQKLKDYKL